MRILHIVLFLFLNIYVAANLTAQELLPNNYWFTNSEDNKAEIDFRLINNTIRIPALVNGTKDTLHFIVDSGLKVPLLIHLGDRQLKGMKFSRDMVVRGLGLKDSLIVKTSYENFLRFPGLININEYINVVEEDSPFLTTSSGVEINGLVGYTLLKDFVVDINYYKRKISFYRPESYKKRRWWLRRKAVLPLEIYKSKPYVTIKVENSKGIMTDVKLLLDTGYSQAIWLDTNDEKGLVYPKDNIKCIMGTGLSGNVLGRLGYLPKIEIGKIRMKDVPVTYPDTIQYEQHSTDSMRMGSMGGELLRRFRVIINYKDNEVTFLRNPDFRNAYMVNKTGMIVEKPFLNLPVYVVSCLIKGEAADKSGVKAGDIILNINDKNVADMTTAEVLSYIHTKKSNLKIIIDRNGKEKIIKMHLPKGLKYNN